MTDQEIHQELRRRAERRAGASIKGQQLRVYRLNEFLGDIRDLDLAVVDKKEYEAMKGLMDKGGGI